MNNNEKADFWLQPGVQEVLQALMGLVEDDLFLANTSFLRPFSPSQRAALLEQHDLQKRAVKKFNDPRGLLFTKLGLEQCTREPLAKYKASKLNQFPLIADLCCGIGGDSMFLETESVGVDWQKAMVKLYGHNLGRKGKRTRVIQADVLTCPVKAQAALLDPARRMSGQKHWSNENLSPNLEVIKSIITRYGNVCLKLGPGAPFLEDVEGEMEYLGFGDECLELDIWTGDLGKAGQISAIDIKSGLSLSLPFCDIADTFGNVQEPGKYLYEPLKVIVRSHLFGVLACELGLWQIDSQIAYLSGNKLLHHPLLKSFKVLACMPFNLKRLKLEIKKLNLGPVDVKNRGVLINKAGIERELKITGQRPGIVFLTRVKNKKTAIVAERL